MKFYRIHSFVMRNKTLNYKNNINWILNFNDNSLATHKNKFSRYCNFLSYTF